MSELNRGLRGIIGQRGRRMSPPDFALAERMKTIRKLRGHTLSSLADSMGITYQQLHKYELGENRIPAPRLKQLADIYGIDINLFFDKGDQLEPGAPIAGLLSVQTVRLVEAFEQIEDEGIRKALYQLVKAAAARFTRKTNHA